MLEEPGKQVVVTLKAISRSAVSKNEYDLGIDWEPIPDRTEGCQIQELHGGGTAFLKQQLEVVIA